MEAEGKVLESEPHHFAFPRGSHQEDTARQHWLDFVSTVLSNLSTEVGGPLISSANR
jgi:hypothetical protein